MVVKPQIDMYDQYIPYPQYLKLLVRATDASTGIKDFSGYGRIVTIIGNTTGSSSQIKINPYSIYFDGNGDGLSVPEIAELQMGTGDFTISFWVNYSVSSSYKTIFATGLSSNQLTIQTDNSSNNKIVIHVSGSAVITDSSNSSSSVWYNYILQRSSGTLTLYKNGISVGTTANTTNYGSFYDNKLYVGIDRGASSSMNGYLNEVLYWKGIAVPISQIYNQKKPWSFRRA